MEQVCPQVKSQATSRHRGDRLRSANDLRTAISATDERTHHTPDPAIEFGRVAAPHGGDSHVGWIASRGSGQNLQRHLPDAPHGICTEPKPR